MTDFDSRLILFAREGGLLAASTAELGANHVENISVP